MNLKPLLQQIANQYRLPPDGLHGLSHWGRVLENGLRMTEIEGGDPVVITLFAIFHDACRHNQSLDPGHGDRGAKLAEALLRDNPDINSSQLSLLTTACSQHTDGQTEGDLSVQICWDSDRLDLARVGIFPEIRFLCTAAAKDEQILSWANTRAFSNYTPDIVDSEWSPLFT